MPGPFPDDSHFRRSPAGAWKDTSRGARNLTGWPAACSIGFPPRKPSHQANLKLNRTNTEEFETVARIIQRRRTTKVFAADGSPLAIDPAVAGEFDARLRRSVEVAGWAPFHFDRAEDGLPEPWRAHILWHTACRRLAQALPELVDVPPKNRQQALLNGCGALVLVTWLPVSGLADPGRQRMVNEEHLAAAAAMAENLLLMLEAGGMENYWASAGLLAAPPVRKYLALPDNQEIIAAIYAGYPRHSGAAVELASGKNRAVRSPFSAWTQESR